MATKAEATVDEIIGDLRLTFENELTGQLREKQFNKCRQGRGEPNEATMYNSVRTLASQAYRAEDRATMEKKTRDAFLDGLEDETRYNVKDKNPRTSRAAFDEALRQEILGDDRAAAAQRAQTAAIFEEKRVLNEKWDSQHTQRKTNRQPGPQNKLNNSGFQGKSISQGACFFCGISGHMARYCYRKRNALTAMPNRRALQNHQQSSANHVNAATTDNDLQSQLEMYRKQVADSYQ
uniref:CCHC-type domain-containing protein n=1 Tax=Caenorhabditis japonica TaxID=281687 RepID=A0A8R1HKB1_CAEJA